MIDHIGFGVADYAAAKAFYAAALAPLGYTLVKEVTAEQAEAGAPRRASDAAASPISGSAGKGARRRPRTSPSPPRPAPPSMHFTPPP